jgi:hypothetical protein
MILRNTLSETNLNSFCGTVFEREFVILAMKEAAELSGGTPVYWYEKVPPVRQWFTARFTGLRSDKTPFEVLDLRKDDMVLEYPDGRIETYPAGMIDSVGYHHLEGASVFPNSAR